MGADFNDNPMTAANDLDAAEAPPLDLEATNDEPMTGQQEGQATRRGSSFEVIEFREGFHNGVHFFPPSDGETEAKPIWICSPLRVVARTRNDHQEGHGRVLEFPDADGHLHQWAMPMSLLAGDGTELRSTLLSMGLELSQNRKARELLADYIQRARPERTARCVDKTGWHGQVFVMPENVIGRTMEMVLFQSATRETPGFGVAGSLEDWRANVGALCRKNSRLLFAVSMAFAAPLLALVGDESGGFNLVGASSCGKSTALRAATSAWGEPGRKQNWRATSNGLEGVALAHHDALLCLDEMAQIDPREAGETAYMLANGVGKARANRDGSARRPVSWRTLFLSAGEIGLAGHMLTAGKRARAGQEIRLADIPADAGAGLGLFEELHGHATGAGLADAIGQASSRFYGTAARAFLERLASNIEAVPSQVEGFRREFLAAVLPPDADGQARRVAGRFALVAAGGEMASTMGVSGWEQGEAKRAAQVCLQSWLAARGGSGPQEERAALAQVRLFFEQHGESRFTPWNGQDRVTINRAGFRRAHELEGHTEYYVLPETFKTEVCAGLDERFVLRLLKDRGALLTGGEDNRFAVKPRLHGMGPTRCYRLVPHLLEGTA
ncbi:MAG: DUF927 domain-containing protein [Magnetococcales bacterium]|nr:DUF927 domain-containing protein [Magnetococcales bacterium]